MITDMKPCPVCGSTDLWCCGETKPPPKSKALRGFAGMSPERRAEIARMGGKAVPADKRSFSQSRELATRAGRAGGASVPAGRRSFSQSPALASDAGRKGGAAVPEAKRAFTKDRSLATKAAKRSRNKE